MTNKPAISIIIPVYNAMRYIRTAIESIIEQTFTDWELILVDDCSTDNSADIIKEYVSRDNRIIYHKLLFNSGSAKYPLDTGVACAKADWVTSLGNDDYFLPSTLEVMYKRAKDTNADIICQQMYGFSSSNERHLFSIPTDDFDYSQIIPPKQACSMTIGGWQISLNGALIQRDIWVKNSTFLKKDTCMNMDEFDSRDMLLRANRVAFVNQRYMYRRHSESITTKLSYKSVETIIVNRMLFMLILDNYGKASYEYKRMRKIIIKDILLAKVKCFKMCGVDKQKSIQIINKECENYNFKFIIQSNIKPHYKALYYMPLWVINSFFYLKSFFNH